MRGKPSVTLSARLHVCPAARCRFLKEEIVGTPRTFAHSPPPTCAMLMKMGASREAEARGKGQRETRD